MPNIKKQIDYLLSTIKELSLEVEFLKNKVNFMEYNCKCLSNSKTELDKKTKDEQIYKNNLYLEELRKGDIETVRLLETKGIDELTIKSNLNEKYINAYENVHLEIMEYLVEKGFDIWDKNNFGIEEYLLSLDYGYSEFIEKYKNKNLKKEDHKIYLTACRKGHLNVMKHLEKLGIDIDIKDKNGYNPYLLACWGGQLEIMKHLEEIGIDIHDKNNGCENAYLLACRRGYLNIIKHLEKIGIDINSKQNNGFNPYLKACNNRNLEIMKHLEEIGIDIHAKTKFGNNAYLLACCNGHIEIMKHLENIGVDIHAKNNKGKNAYSVAFNKKHLKIIEHLREKGFT